jgi:hypothetical protein
MIVMLYSSNQYIFSPDLHLDVCVILMPFGDFVVNNVRIIRRESVGVHVRVWL